MFNKVILVGNITRDIELKTLSSGLIIANTALAVSRKYTANGEKKDETCFIDITFFSKLAGIAHQYLEKGNKVLIEGRLKQESWENEQGEKKSKHCVIVENMRMLTSRQGIEKIQQDATEFQANHNIQDKYETLQAISEDEILPF